MVSNGETKGEGLPIQGTLADQGDQGAALITDGEGSCRGSGAGTGESDLGFAGTTTDQLPAPPLQVAIG